VSTAVTSKPGESVEGVPLADSPIVFYDGECGMCNSFVDFVLRRDKTGRIRFAPLQGETAARLLGRTPDDPLDGMELLDASGRFRCSDAATGTLARMGGIWGVVGVLCRFVPRLFREPVYRLIARNRYALFGKKSGCRLPTPAERRRFLP
jgi:predicted DCC family thiol-disulfide oxidoreductase YuxK